MDLEEVARASHHVTRSVEDGGSKLYLGRDNSNMRNTKYAKAAFDEVEMCYADRERLMEFDFIQRGKLHSVAWCCMPLFSLSIVSYAWFAHHT